MNRVSNTFIRKVTSSQNLLKFGHLAGQPFASYVFIVAQYYSQRLAGILRETVRRVELSADISQDDCALLELKRVLLLKIAALEADAAESSAGADDLDRPPRAA
jgi:hypothetical protein